MKFDLTLYLISDSTGLTEDEFLRRIEQALQGGVTLLQIREKNRTTLEYYELAKKVKKLTDAYQIPLIIDDRVDIALAVDAQGVHVGAEDMPVREARRLMGPDKIIGATAKRVETAMQAEADGADYLGVGAIYPTTTKVKTVITSVETLQDICQHVSIPVGAIGGLHAENCDILKGTGIQGICVVSAIMKQKDPRTAAKVLKEKALAIRK
ncbi:thiamine phosphate synthase [[Clostridium] innocuum]|nr:thiamine phosphate synthase [[Clostridium] innocuum]